MESRLNIAAASPQAYKVMADVESYLSQCGLEESLRELVKLRASQINGCAYCLDMHWKDARANGESEQRLYGLDAWRESPYYTARERAALAWTEALTLVAQTHAPDEAFDEVRAEFNDKELTDLSLLIATINSWNRLAIGFRATPGLYKPGVHSR